VERKKRSQEKRVKKRLMRGIMGMIKRIKGKGKRQYN
jgi:hypothetical protein